MFQDYWGACGQEWEEIAGILEDATGYLVLNPGIYGASWHALRVELYPPEHGGLLGVGLNPGPYGMAQTGIPFTDIKRILECLPHLRRTLEETEKALAVPGLAPSSLQPYLKLHHEASAVRVYRFLEQAFGDAENGLTQFAFANPCPLLFIEKEIGKNRTPADFRTRIRKVHPGWSRTQVQTLIGGVTERRLRSILAGVEALKARGVVLFGKDVQRAVGEELRQALGASRVLFYPHPARAVPDTWSRQLIMELQQQRLL